MSSWPTSSSGALSSSSPKSTKSRAFCSSPRAREKDAEDLGATQDREKKKGEDGQKASHMQDTVETRVQAGRVFGSLYLTADTEH